MSSRFSGRRSSGSAPSAWRARSESSASPVRASVVGEAGGRAWSIDCLSAIERCSARSSHGSRISRRALRKREAGDYLPGSFEVRSFGRPTTVTSTPPSASRLATRRASSIVTASIRPLRLLM